MAKARKLKSGNWNIQVFDYRDEQGKKHFTSFTAPAKYEVEFMASEYKKNRPVRNKKQDVTVGQAIDRYMELCGVLSPTTSESYTSVRQNAFQNLMNTPVKKLTNETVQKAINEECKRIRNGSDKPISAKTVKNEWGLISAALNKICGVNYDISLPKVKRQIKQYPDPKDVLKAITDCEAKLPCLLSMWCTFSMSELLGIRCSDITNGCIVINQVRIRTKDGLVEKDIAKTVTRNRAQILPDYLLDLIRETAAYQRYTETGEDGYLIESPRSTIYHQWKRAAAKHGLDLTFHDLRHMSASVMLQLNVPEKYAQERGGWSTPNVMRTVYQHTFSSERVAVDNLINDYFAKSLNELSEREIKNR